MKPANRQTVIYGLRVAAFFCRLQSGGGSEVEQAGFNTMRAVFLAMAEARFTAEADLIEQADGPIILE